MIISVDGGATKTIAVLVHGNELKGLGISGPSNFNAVGKDVAIENILEAVKMAKGENKKIKEGIFSLAGVGDSEESDRIANEICNIVSNKMEIESYRIYNDGVSAYRMANLFEDGIVVASGTGNVNYFQKGDTLRRLGGWGWFAGDEGSASWIGRRALTYAIRQYDGIFEGDELINAAEEYFGKPFKELIWSLEIKPNKPLVAGFATKVVELANKGSKYADLILTEASEYIVSVIKRLLKEFDVIPRVSLVGGLMMAGDILVNKIRNQFPFNVHVFYGYQVAMGGVAILENMKSFDDMNSLLQQLDLLIKRNFSPDFLQKMLFFREPPGKWG